MTEPGRSTKGKRPEREVAKVTRVLRSLTEVCGVDDRDYYGAQRQHLPPIKISTSQEAELKKAKSPAWYYIKVIEMLMATGLKVLADDRYDKGENDPSGRIWAANQDTLREVYRVINNTAPISTTMEAEPAVVASGHVKKYLEDLRTSKMGNIIPEYYKLYALGDEAEKYGANGDKDNLRLVINKIQKTIAGKHLDQSIQQWVLYQYIKYLAIEKKESDNIDIEVIESWSYSKIMEEVDKVCLISEKLYERAQEKSKIVSVFLAQKSEKNQTIDKSSSAKVLLCKGCKLNESHRWDCDYYGLPGFGKDVKMSKYYMKNIRQVVERENKKRSNNKPDESKP